MAVLRSQFLLSPRFLVAAAIRAEELAGVAGWSTLGLPERDTEPWQHMALPDLTMTTLDGE